MAILNCLKKVCSSIGSRKTEEQIDKVLDSQEEKAHVCQLIKYPSNYCPYQIYIKQEAWQQMNYYVKHCDTELGAHLLVERLNEKLVVSKVYFPSQDVSFSSYSPTYRDLYNIIPRNDMCKIKGWFHSHVNFAVMWSGDDNDTIVSSLKVFGDFCLSIVMNKQGEYRIRIDEFDSKGNIRSFDDLKYIILLKGDEVLEQRCVLDIKQKVTQSMFSSYMSSRRLSSNYKIKNYSSIYYPEGGEPYYLTDDAVGLFTWFWRLFFRDEEKKVEVKEDGG